MFYGTVAVITALIKVRATVITLIRHPIDTLKSIPVNGRRNWLEVTVLDPIEAVPGAGGYPILVEDSRSPNIELEAIEAYKVFGAMVAILVSVIVLVTLLLIGPWLVSY